MTKKSKSKRPTAVDTSRGRAGRPQSLFAPRDDEPSADVSTSDETSGSAPDAAPEVATDPPPATSEAPATAPAPPHSGGAVETHGLTRKYGDAVALEPIDLHIPLGQRVALVGHNGSGKTTLIRMITGTLDPTEGSIYIGSHPVGSLEARASLSYLADQPVFYDDLSLVEHIEYIARLHGRSEWTEPATQLMERLGISHRADDLPVTFSRGLKQKAAICLAFIRPFDLLVVDEPFVGLDSAGRAELLALLDESQEAGCTLLVATHELQTVAASDRLLALANGALIYDGSPDVDVDTLVDGVAVETVGEADPSS